MQLDFSKIAQALKKAADKRQRTELVKLAFGEANWLQQAFGRRQSRGGFMRPYLTANAGNRNTLYGHATPGNIPLQQRITPGLYPEISDNPLINMLYGTAVPWAAKKMGLGNIATSISFSDRVSPYQAGYAHSDMPRKLMYDEAMKNYAGNIFNEYAFGPNGIVKQEMGPGYNPKLMKEKWRTGGRVAGQFLGVLNPDSIFGGMNNSGFKDIADRFRNPGDRIMAKPYAPAPVPEAPKIT